MTLAAGIAGVGLVGPGLADWAHAMAVLRGEAPYEPQATVLPSPAMLPAVERRRAGKAVRLALGAGLAAAQHAGRDPKELAAIFASSGGDGDTLHAICDALASDDRQISPTRFHNSVHNAPAGYWGIATGAMTPADCIAAYDATFAAGLIEALGRLAADPHLPVLLVTYDAPYPEPLFAKRPVVDGMGVGLVLVAEGPARISLELAAGTPTTMADPALEHLRMGVPPGRALPLLRALALGRPERLLLEYSDGACAALSFTP